MNVYGGVSWLAISLSCAVVLLFRRKIESKFHDRSNLVFNEQVKMTATALNNISVALIVGGILLPIFQGHSELGNEWTKGGTLTVWALMFGGFLHFLALFVLGKMRG